MSSLEKLVRKSEKVNNVYVAGKVFFRLSVTFLFISFGIFIIGSIELRNTELTSTKGIIFITLCAISILEFLIFIVLAAIIGIYGIFLEAIQSTKSLGVRNWHEDILLEYVRKYKKYKSYIFIKLIYLLWLP